MTDPTAVIRLHQSGMLDQMIFELIENYDALVELAIERSTSIGAAEYGDASFHKTRETLTRERFEEYADAIFYGCVEHHIRKG